MEANREEKIRDRKKQELWRFLDVRIWYMEVQGVVLV